MKKTYLTLLLFFLTSFIYAQEPFITTWEVPANSLNINVPVVYSNSNNYSIDFGDGTIETNLSTPVNHTYASAGTYTVSISGNIGAIAFAGVNYQNLIKLKTIEQWGDIEWTSMVSAFNGCSNLVINAQDTPNLSNVSSISNMFAGALSINQPINDWDVSNVTDMSNLFYGASSFNQPLDNWDVSNVTDMSYMFSGAISFNQPIGNWDVSNVTDIQLMFDQASSFNQPLNNWDVSNVTNMTNLFLLASSFNQPLNNWDVSSVTNMEGVFNEAVAFNQPLDNWDISNVTNVQSMFHHAASFNQDLSAWNFQSPFLYYFISYSGLDTNNYDLLLLRFIQLGIEEETFFSDEMEYCDTAIHDYLTDVLGWAIYGDSLGESCIGNTISGSLSFDFNNDGCDESDLLINNVIINATNNFTDYSASTIANGTFDLKVYDNTYTIELLGLPDYYIVTPVAPEITFEGYGNTEVLNFCVTANQSTEDLNVTILPVNEARPGFEAEYQLVVENIGTQTVTDATVSFTYNDAMQSFVSAVPAASSNSDNVLTFNLSDFQPFESRVIDITMETFTPPTVNGDDILNFTATVTPNENDYTPQDNTFEFAQTVVNSFDPNDKRVVQGSEIYIEQATEYLDYIIRFQNTGTASAINIRVEDILSDDVDWSTFRPVSSSHDYRIEITDDNHVEFIFENINLPFEGEDEAGSNGFIAYKIKPVAGLEVGDIIHSNEVNIYFDYNLPIVTNSVTTQIIELLGVSDNILNKSLVLYPNPANDILYIKAENNVLPEEVVIYNLQGRELMAFNQNLESMDISDLSSGIYLVTVQTSGGRADYRLVKK